MKKKNLVRDVLKAYKHDMISSDKAEAQIKEIFLECVGEDKIVQIADSNYGGYRTKGEICIHGINLSNLDKLCLECAGDTGYNQAKQEIRTKIEEVMG